MACGINNDSECDLFRMTEENMLNGKLRPFFGANQAVAGIVLVL